MNKLNKDRRKRITDDPGGQRWDREFQEAAPSDDEPALTIELFVCKSRIRWSSRDANDVPQNPLFRMRTLEAAADSAGKKLRKNGRIQIYFPRQWIICGSWWILNKKYLLSPRFRTNQTDEGHKASGQWRTERTRRPAKNAGLFFCIGVKLFSWKDWKDELTHEKN